MSFTDERLKSVVHRLGHYKRSHGNLPVTILASYLCDDDQEWNGRVGYDDLREALEELIDLRGIK